MSKSLNWPNLVTISRLVLVFVVVILVYGHTLWDGLLAAALAVLLVVSDWLDGHLARRLDQATALGSVLDIAADRILETVMWIILADIDLIPIWIPLVVIARGFLTDGIRGYMLKFGYSGFGSKTLQQSKIGKFITGSRIMRSGYAVLKGFTFGWLLLLAAIDQVLFKWKAFESEWVHIGFDIGYWAAVLAAVVCIIRGIPVVIEGAALIREKSDEA
ncbi:hypothetical protein GF420_05280 [candidate division GN15 bacterium]|nr:hypothetical protein [candidate division GN15 bacterium]